MNSLSISSSATPTTAPAIAEQQKYAALLAELATGHCSRSYWARKARMRALEAELSSLDYKLLEFDIAFNFHDAVDLARSAENIFQADKSNEKVRQRIGQLFSALLNDTSNQDNQNDSNSQNFSTELVSQLSMERLQEMFFFAFPEQRNSTRGSLQVYLTLASNRPQTLGSIATKLFAYYLGASAEFQRGQKQPTTNKAAADMQSIITPMDAVLFFLFDSLVQADFGDLSVHNISQVFQILLHNCFADSLGRVPDNFYSQSGIPCLAHIRRPALSWHFCLQVLAQLYRKRGLDQLANMLLPEYSASADGEKEIIEDLSSTLERSLADPKLGPQLLQSVDFVRLALRWAMAGPLGKRQTDLRNQLVWVPANVFWVDPSGLDHYWVYNMDAEEEDSPAEIEEPQQGEKSLGIEPGLLHPIRLLNTLFSIPGAVAEQELAQLAMSNAQSVVLLALMATENWKRAAELLKQLDIPMPDASSQQQLILQLQRVQALIALRKLAAAFPTCHQLLANFSEDEKTQTEDTEQKMEEELPEFPALIVAQDANWVHLEQRVHLRLYLQLLLFHLFWLGFAKCQKSGGVRAKKGTELMFLALMLVAQSCWEHFGFGLFEQLVDHVASKEHFRCPGLLNWLNNQMLLGQLLGMDHVLMNFSATPADSGSFSTPAQICQAILQGKARMCAEPSAMVILNNFLNEFQHQIVEVLQMLL